MKVANGDCSQRIKSEQRKYRVVRKKKERRNKSKARKKGATETFLVKLLFRTASDRFFFFFSPTFAGSSALKWVKCEEKEESSCCHTILYGESGV